MDVNTLLKTHTQSQFYLLGKGLAELRKVVDEGEEEDKKKASGLDFDKPIEAKENKF